MLIRLFPEQLCRPAPSRQVTRMFSSRGCNCLSKCEHLQPFSNFEAARIRATSQLCTAVDPEVRAAGASLKDLREQTGPPDVIRRGTINVTVMKVVLFYSATEVAEGQNPTPVI